MKKRNIIIIIAIILLICIIVGIGYFVYIKSKQSISQSEKTAKITQIYQNLVENPVYKFSMTYDDENYMAVSIKNDKANIDIKTEGEHLTKIVKEGNTYLLVHPREKYYIYQNNEIELTKITMSLEKIKDRDYSIGKEKLNEEKYYYEEFQNFNSMMLRNEEDSKEENSKTRFYFNKDGNIEYIKTIWNDKEELLKIDLTQEVEDSLFEIPSNYKQG